MRSPSGGNGKPKRSCSACHQPVPKPTSMRPPDTWSAVSASLARTAGARNVTGETSVPSRMPSVTAASAQIVPQASSAPPRSGRSSTEW